MPPAARTPSSAPPARVRCRSWRGLAGLGALLAALLVLAAPQPAAAQDRLVFRAVFQTRELRPARELVPGREEELRDGFWRVSGARRLRVQSSDPGDLLVLRFDTADPRSGALVLSVILVGRRTPHDFQYGRRSEVMAGGRIVPRKELAVGEGVVTDLAGAAGEVAEIRIEDDATAELRLLQRDDELLLRAIPAREGGELSGRTYPVYWGRTLAFLDYDLLAGGWDDNGYGEAVLFEHFALKLNGFAEEGESAAAARLVVRQQLVRSRTLALSLEGGGGLFTQDPADPAEEHEGEATWSFGLTAQFRRGDWGAALHAATINGPTLLMALGGWQFSSAFAAFLQWQSFLGFSAFGAGLAIDF